MRWSVCHLERVDEQRRVGQTAGELARRGGWVMIQPSRASGMQLTTWNERV